MTEVLLKKAEIMLHYLKEAEEVVRRCGDILHAMQDDPNSWPRRRIKIEGWNGVPEWKPSDDVYCDIVRQIKISAENELKHFKKHFAELE